MSTRAVTVCDVCGGEQAKDVPTGHRIRLAVGVAVDVCMSCMDRPAVALVKAILDAEASAPPQKRSVWEAQASLTNKLRNAGQ